MRPHETLIILAALGVAAWPACSGKTTADTELPAPPMPDSGADAHNGTPCGSDVKAVSGGLECKAALPSCTAGNCFRSNGTWTCTTRCPCAAGWECVPALGGTVCVPSDVAACFGTGGTGGSGTGGAGGSGGSGGQGDGGIGGTGAFGGSGGTGPCGGYDACTGKTMAFCSENKAELLSCSATAGCPTVTSCSALCPSCACHMIPPSNGVLDGTCDTCTDNTHCSGNLVCGNNPMYPGSGAKTCVSPN